MRLAEMMARKFHGVEVEQGGKQVVLELDLPKRADGSPRVLGPGGWIRLKWGAYFSPTETDKQMQVTTIVSAKTSELIDSETAINQAAPIFGVQDAKKMIAKIEEQKASDQEDFNMELPPPVADQNEPPGPPAGQGGKP